MIKIKLWDSIGQEKYRSLNKSFYREALGAFLLADLSRHNVRKDKEGKERNFLLDDLNYWLKEFKETADPNVQIILIGNMVDRDVIPSNLAIMEKFAADNNIKFFKTSAKTGESCDEAVDELLKLLDQEYFSSPTRSRDKSRKRLTTKDYRSFEQEDVVSDDEEPEAGRKNKKKKERISKIEQDLNLFKRLRKWFHHLCPVSTVD